MANEFFILNGSTGAVIPLSESTLAKIVKDLSSSSLHDIGYSGSSSLKGKRVRMSRLDSGVFIYAVVSDGQLLMPDVEPTDMARLVRLVSRLNWIGNLPAKTFDVDFLQKELDIKQSAAYKFIRFLKGNFGKRLELVEDALSPTFFKGSLDDLKKRDEDVRGVKIYVQPYAEAYKYNGKYDRSALGCLIKLAPFVNKATGILCQDVGITRENLMNPLETNDIADLLRIDRKHFRERVIPVWHKTLIPTNGEMLPIVKNIRGLYVVNPALMAASKYDAGVWEYFLNGKIEEDE